MSAAFLLIDSNIQGETASSQRQPRRMPRGQPYIVFGVNEGNRSMRCILSFVKNDRMEVTNLSRQPPRCAIFCFCSSLPD